MGTSGFIILFSPLLRMFDIFHNKMLQNVYSKGGVRGGKLMSHKVLYDTIHNEALLGVSYLLKPARHTFLQGSLT